MCYSCMFYFTSVPRLPQAHRRSHRGSSAVHAGDLQQGRSSTTSLQPVRQACAQRHHASGGGQSQARQDPALALGASPGQDCALKALCLLNRSNFCYANALVIDLLHIRDKSAVPLYSQSVDNFFLDLLRASNRHLWDDPAWRIQVRGWKRPAQQHDVAEFCSFLDSRDMFRHRCFQGKWQARSAEGGFRVTDAGSTWPLFLAELPTEDCSVQTLIDDWHGQACIHALSEAPAFLLIQLNRFSGDDGGRSHCRVQHGDTLSIPTFRNAAVPDTETQLLQYRLVSTIIHKGVHSTSGPLLMMQIACGFMTTGQHPHHSMILMTCTEMPIFSVSNAPVELRPPHSKQAEVTSPATYKFSPGSL